MIHHVATVPVSTPLSSAFVTNCVMDAADGKQEKVNEILSLKNDISKLIQNIRKQTMVCQKYSDENQYLQDYIGTVMKSGDLK